MTLKACNPKTGEPLKYDVICMSQVQWDILMKFTTSQYKMNAMKPTFFLVVGPLAQPNGRISIPTMKCVCAASSFF